MLAKKYFEALVKVTNTYKQNAGGSTTGRNKYESANQLADCGNKIRNYIAQIASAAAANNDHAANTQANDTQFDAMSVQIKALTKAVTKLTATKGNKNINPNTTNGNKGNGKRRQPQRRPQPEQLTKLRNIGGYCHSHGFHLVGPSHDSKNYNWRLVNTTSMPRGAIAWAAALTGLWPSELPSNSKITHCGRERQRLLIDGSRGRQVTKRLHPTMPHSIK
jgi:hypothetical protein